MSLTRSRLSEVTGRWLIITVLCALNLCASAGEQQFGRLFTTQQERQRLQQLREENRRMPRPPDHAGTGTQENSTNYHIRPAQAALSPSPEGHTEELPVVTLKGLIYKKNKARMAWINSPEEAAGSDYRVLEAGQIADNDLSIRVPVAGKSVKLKPGQSYHTHSGAVTDLKESAR